MCKYSTTNLFWNITLSHTPPSPPSPPSHSSTASHIPSLPSQPQHTELPQASHEEPLQEPATTTTTDQSALFEAIYDYEGEAEGDLSFKEGDLIQVTAQEGEWWTGVLRGVSGIFPSNYVQPKQRTPSPTGSAASYLSEQANVVVHTTPLIARVTVGKSVSKSTQHVCDVMSLIELWKFQIYDSDLSYSFHCSA